MALTASAIACEATAADTDSLSVDTAFNALDYVLQRPAPTRRFEHKKFGDHLFLTAEGGFSFTRESSESYISSKTGYRAGITVGDWITPVYGWRVGLNAGRHYANDAKPYFVGGSADFLLNFTGLLRGNTDFSRFEVIGAAGFELQALHDSHNWIIGGARLGLQMRWNATPTTFFFVEPRIGIYSDKLDDSRSWHHYDMQGQVMAGIGYRMNRLGDWGHGIDNSEFVNERFSDNLFFGATAGIAVFSNTPNDLFETDRMTGFGGGFIGKWFAAPSAVRLQLQAGKRKHSGTLTRNMLLGDADYILNLNTLLNGYDPDRRFELNVFAGVSVAAINQYNARIVPGLHGGIQGILNITRNIGLFIEPNLRLFSHKVLGPDFNGTHAQTMSQLSAGLILRSRPSRHRDLSELIRQEREKFAKTKHFFVSGAAGIFGRDGEWVPNMVATASVGMWLTPQSGFRVTLGADHYGLDKNPFHSIFAGIDYMTDLSTIMYGYEPERIFNLRGFAGFNLGGGRYKSCNHFIGGAQAGLQAAFRLTEGLEFFVEPSVQVMRIPDYTRNLNPQWRVMAGLTYYMGKDRELSERRRNLNRFFSLGAGSGAMSQATFHGVPLTISAAYGSWINDINGLQISGQYFGIKPFPGSNKVNVFTAGIDYMLNLTALLNNGNAAQYVNLIGLIGPAVGWSNVEQSNATAGGRVGAQLRWQLADHLTLTLTPSVVMLGRRIYGEECNHRFFATGTAEAGLSFAF